MKLDGPQSAQSLADRFGVSVVAIRQHLTQMHESGLVRYRSEPREIGRPARIWELADGATAHFPDGHADLALLMIESAREAFGEDGLRKLVQSRARRIEATYLARIPADAEVSERVKRLADLRSAEGYMAAWCDNQDGSFTLIENHCPICIAAQACNGLCDSELNLFRKVLGPEVSIERTEHIVQGARRCMYEIRPADCAAASGAAAVERV